MKKGILATMMVVSVWANQGLYTEKCSGCHGDNGKMVDVAGKTIAGNSNVAQKLKEYQSGLGGANKESMIPVAKELNEAQIASLSEYIAKMK